MYGKQNGNNNKRKITMGFRWIKKRSGRARSTCLNKVKEDLNRAGVSWWKRITEKHREPYVNKSVYLETDSLRYQDLESFIRSSTTPHGVSNLFHSIPLMYLHYLNLPSTAINFIYVLKFFPTCLSNFFICTLSYRLTSPLIFKIVFLSRAILFVCRLHKVSISTRSFYKNVKAI